MGAEIDTPGPGHIRGRSARAGAMLLNLQWRPYRFRLPRALVTSQGSWSLRQGWLLRLEAADGGLGWGEAALPPMPHPARKRGGTAWPEQNPMDPGRLARETWSSAGVPGPEAPEAPAMHRQDARTEDGDHTPLRAESGRDQPQPESGGRDDPGAGSPAAAIPPELRGTLRRRELETRLPALPRPLACALGMALAELDGLGARGTGGWLPAPVSAELLPAGEAALAELERLLARRDTEAHDRSATALTGARPDAEPPGLTVKWKVASGEDARERQLLEALLTRLPAGSRLRLDANGGWDRATAARWAARLSDEPRLEWLEQPLSPDDPAGLQALATRLPVALDESLRHDHNLLCRDWSGWQVRRPLAEGDPRPLLEALEAGRPRLMLSTALETGIGRRFLHHLAGLQALGPTPTAPGLAPGWRPRGHLFSADPAVVWEASSEGDPSRPSPPDARNPGC